MGRIKRGVAAVAVAAATAVGMGAPGASATNVGVSGAVGTGFISYTPPLGVTPVHTTWSYSTTIIGLAIAAAVPPPPLPAISPTYTAACTFAGSSNGILGSPPVGEDAAVGGGSVTGTCAADASGTRLALAGTGTYARVGNVMVITGPATLTVGGIIVPGSMRAVVVLLPNTTSLNNFSAVWVSSFTIA